MQRPPKKRTTILDIAMKLGLSAMTVSRALTGKAEVSHETKQKVIRCAASLGYQPHRWARSLVTRRSSIIGVVIPEIWHSFFSEIICGVEEIVDQAGYDILLCHSRGNAEKEKEEIHTLVGSMVAGLIVASVQPEMSPGPLVELDKMGIPFVLVDRFFPRHRFSSIRVDDRAVGRLAAQCLIDLGHTHIACINGPDLSPASQRRRGFLDAIKTARLKVPEDFIAAGNFDFDSGSRAMTRLLALHRRPTAVFAANDPMAVGAILACREAGLRVPQDVSIVGAGNIEGDHHPNPFVTTLDWPREGLGRLAAKALLEAIENPARKANVVHVLEPRLLIRQSTDRPFSG